ncbi:MAG TPA: ATP-dependent RecD-like DNA helicase [Candidatus Binatia bacterium]|nr:ATP-dependent RecD-like DNA helicase [Candidatus Binatia bacterium]
MEPRNEQATLQGAIKRITYRHSETHYTVARLEVDGVSDVTVVGEFFAIAEGEEIKVTGHWKNHPKYGLQFQVAHWEKIDPATVEGMEKYLGSGLIKGIGPIYAKRLVAAFGRDTLRVLSEEPLRILDVDGIGEIRARRILQAWQEQRGMQDVMVFLQGHGVGASMALRIYRVFGSQTVARIKENPYVLAREVRGIGFVLADRIANHIGIHDEFPLRIEAGVLHVLREFSDQGHCFVPLVSLKRNAAGLLNVGEDPVEAAVDRLARNGDLALQEISESGVVRVYLHELYQAERRVTTALHHLLSTPSLLQGEKIVGPWKDSRGAVDLLSPELFGPSFIQLDQDQVRATQQALQEKVLVITGGPGTGKTTLLKALLTILRRARVSFALAAPTGRAAKRITESAGEEAMTIHRLLEYSPREGCFQRNEDNPLQVDFVIIDEASMVDLTLMDHLLRAVDAHSHLILLGDVDQLPSVGPGSVLRDLIDSAVIPTVVLRRIFRQDRESLIVANAHRILQGQWLRLVEGGEKADFIFEAREREEEILQTVKELAREGVRQWLKLEAEDVSQAIQVLTPMHRGMLGTVNLNRELQTLLNPAGTALERGGLSLRVGDKVMQLRNNYDKGVFNGDLGRIAAIDAEEGRVKIHFYDKSVEYEADEIDEINLAYATSIHKSQGSEYPAVIVPLHTSHYVMLHRSILYTAVTRGKKLVVLVGSRKALAMAIRNVRLEKRNTGLREKLTEISKL